MKESNWKFGVGDIARLKTGDRLWLVKIVLPIIEEDGVWWYEVECVDPDVSEVIRKNYHREVPQDALIPVE